MILVDTWSILFDMRSEGKVQVPRHTRAISIDAGSPCHDQVYPSFAFAAMTKHGLSVFPSSSKEPS